MSSQHASFLNEEEEKKSYSFYGHFLASQDSKWIQTWLSVSLVFGVVSVIGFLLLVHSTKLDVFFAFVEKDQLLYGFVGLNYTFLVLPLLFYNLHSLVLRRKNQPEVFLLLAVLTDTYFSYHFKGLEESIGYIPFYITMIVPIVSMFVASLEAYATKKAYHHLKEVKKLKPIKASVLSRDGKIEIRDISDIAIGDLIRVKAGEMIPCDGIIESGATSVDESAFTAENTILLKKKGDRVSGSTINRDGEIEIRVDRIGEDSFFDKIQSLIQGALKNSAKSQEVLDSSFPFLLILILLLLSLIVVTGAYEGDETLAWYRLVGILVSVGFFSVFRLNSIVRIFSVGRAVKQGMFLKSSDYVDTLAKLKYLFLDKTGTLTKGRYYFSQVFLEHGTNQGQFLSAIFSLEKSSRHPLAKGVQTHPWYIEIPKSPVVNFKKEAGLGVCGEVRESFTKSYFAVVGNQRFLKRHQMYISRALREKVDELESMGETVILCGWDRNARGVMSFSDSLSRDVQSFLRRIRSLKIKPIMITGDHDEMISNLTYAHGIEEIYTRCLPEEKAKKIQNRQDEGCNVGMVARLVDNPLPFEQADIGLALGAGTDIKEKPVAGFILGRRLERVADLIEFAQRVSRARKWGFGLSTIVSLFSLIGAATGKISPVNLVFVMTGLSVAFIFFSIRVKEVTNS